VLSLVRIKIAGAVPTWSSLQVLESEVRAAKNAGDCPYPVDGRCPHAGTGFSGERSTHSENDKDPVPGDTLMNEFRFAVEPSADELWI
jgi:hypothetical protein